MRTVKRPQLLLEVLIAIFLIGVFGFPLLGCALKITQLNAQSAQTGEKIRALKCAACEIYQELVQNSIPFQHIEKGLYNQQVRFNYLDSEDQALAKWNVFYDLSIIDQDKLIPPSYFLVKLELFARYDDSVPFQEDLPDEVYQFCIHKSSVKAPPFEREKRS